MKDCIHFPCGYDCSQWEDEECPHYITPQDERNIIDKYGYADR